MKPNAASIASMRTAYEKLLALVHQRDALMEELRVSLEFTFQGVDPTTVKHLRFDAKRVTAQQLQDSDPKAPWHRAVRAAQRPAGSAHRRDASTTWVNVAILRDDTEVTLWPPIKR